MSSLFSVTAEPYIKAAEFGTFVEGLMTTDPETQEDATLMHTWARRAADESTIKAQGLKIEADIHYIDWSAGEAVDKKILELEKVCGTLQGQFIGYVAVMHFNETTMQTLPTLATTILCEINTGGEYAPALVISPIPGAEIEFVET